MSGLATHSWSARLIGDDSGQDLIEYALLTAFIGLAGLAAWVTIRNNLGQAYSGYDVNTQSLWEPPVPTSGS